MAATCTWTGKSGLEYQYAIAKLPSSFTPGKGNYVYAKPGSPGKWIPVYIGEGELNDRADTSKHQQGVCIEERGATHFHWHARNGASRDDRRTEEQDLLGNYTNAYFPQGCNR
ncbi:MAG: hypothetical protein F4139_14195 [Gemmatimonadetes bacterium]|nr:hypothetical protein [Gemmatimonadota bacterium]MYK65375.1 hypothetical protein [Gemmatimonadota bacterium]